VIFSRRRACVGRKQEGLARTQAIETYAVANDLRRPFDLPRPSPSSRARPDARRDDERRAGPRRPA